MQVNSIIYAYNSTLNFRIMNLEKSNAKPCGAPPLPPTIYKLLKNDDLFLIGG